MSLERFVLTLDIDWASDEVIRLCADILETRSVKATWLVTHASDAVDSLADRDDLFELGIHPNFHDGSSHGDTPKAVLDHVSALVPGARSVRTHGLFQSTALLRTMLGDYGIANDLSILLPDTPNIEPHEFHLPEGVLRRFPAFWEDDAEMLRPQPSFDLNDPKFGVPGLKVMTFHPILIALNACALDSYQALKADHDISRLSLNDIDAHINRASAGDQDFFRQVVDHVADAQAGGMTVSELADAWVLSRQQ